MLVIWLAFVGFTCSPIPVDQTRLRWKHEIAHFEASLPILSVGPLHRMKTVLEVNSQVPLLSLRAFLEPVVDLLEVLPG